jgi:hypothetical protein
MHELGDEGVAIGMVDEGAPGAATLLFAADGLGDAPVEAFDHAVGLRVVGPQLKTALLSPVAG